MSLRIRQRSSNQQCPLCFEELSGELGFTCEGCRTDYHLECARELGGCAILGCSHGGIGPDGAASLLTLQRHLQRVLNQGPSAPIGGGEAGERQRAEVIREAVLHERARVVAAEAARRRFQAAQRRKQRAGTLFGYVLLVLTLSGLLLGLLLLTRWLL